MGPTFVTNVQASYVTPNIYSLELTQNHLPSVLTPSLMSQVTASIVGSRWWVAVHKMDQLNNHPPTSLFAFTVAFFAEKECKSHKIYERNTKDDNGKKYEHLCLCLLLGEMLVGQNKRSASFASKRRVAMMMMASEHHGACSDGCLSRIRIYFTEGRKFIEKSLASLAPVPLFAEIMSAYESVLQHYQSKSDIVISHAGHNEIPVSPSVVW